MVKDDREYIKNYDGPPVRIMEVCGTHTSAIFKSGIRSFLSPNIKLASGPGCPVCVTVPEYIDRCIEVSLRPDHELICFGDLLKIPGTERTLSDAKGGGGRVRMVWSPFDAIALAVQDPETTYVVAAIGFETTAPAFALLLGEAEEKRLGNLRLLLSLKSALAAIEWICEAGEDIDAFICPGHVSVITGADAYVPLAEKYGKPFVVAGFEGEQLVSAIRIAVEEAAEGRGCVRNLYTEAVCAEGNKRAKDVIEKYFVLKSAEWRGLGGVAKSGYFLKDAYRRYDFCKGEELDRFVANAPRDDRSAEAPRDDEGAKSRQKGIVPILSHGSAVKDGCRCGDVILGRIDPDECLLFGKACTPARAVGPCMVSAEGACGCWYRGR